MREIKYRAWEKNLREMIPVYDIDLKSKVINNDSAWRMFDEIILMQYTGLKDKNDVEICEGDIVENKKSKVRSVVEFVEGCFMYVYYKDKEKYVVPFHISVEFEEESQCEVLGNIYENPELLELKI